MLDVSRLVALSDEAPYAGDELDPEEELETRRSFDRLERALLSISAADREVLLLVGVEGFEQEQAASIVGVSYAAFRQRLARARARLQDALDKIDKIGARKAKASEVSK